MTRLLLGDTQSSRCKIFFLKNEAAEPVIEGNTAHRDAAGWESARISIQAPMFAIDSLLTSYV
jgi:hypothetical protein